MASTRQPVDGTILPNGGSITDHDDQPPLVSPACTLCRSRKVKCNRGRPVCDTCVRLQLCCSYDKETTSPVSAPRQTLVYTEAGLKRKRTRQACGACRSHKAKCSGAGPCERCIFKGLVCDLPANESQIDNKGAVNIPTPMTMTSVASSTANWPPDKATARRYLDMYFATANVAVPTFLHRPSILADWGAGTFDQNLVKCVMAFGLFLNDSGAEARVTARAWIQEVQDDAFRRIGRQTIAHLRILAVLLRFRSQAGPFADAWSILAIAARAAFTMRLNYEHEGSDPLLQESNRRLVWAIYQLDHIYSGGSEDLAVCPVERMHIRLPCDERSFELGIHSTAGFLDDGGTGHGENVDAHAFKLRLLAIRDRVLRYTKSVRRKGNSPADDRSSMDELQIELNTFERRLPPELKLSPQRLVVMGHSREAGTYVGLHAHWMMCHCDLYRFCVPGIRESVSKDALAQTPAEFIRHCQRACFDTAVRLCALWSDLYHLDSNEYHGDKFLAVSIYQVTQILHHLPHLIPEEGENSVINLQKKLMEALQLAAPVKRIYSSAINCLRDTERLISALGREPAEQSSPEPSAAGGMERAREHLASRHSIIANMYRDKEAAEGDLIIEGQRFSG